MVVSLLAIPVIVIACAMRSRSNQGGNSPSEQFDKPDDSGPNDRPYTSLQLQDVGHDVYTCPSESSAAPCNSRSNDRYSQKYESIDEETTFPTKQLNKPDESYTSLQLQDVGHDVYMCPSLAAPGNSRLNDRCSQTYESIEGQNMQ